MVRTVAGLSQRFKVNVGLHQGSVCVVCGFLPGKKLEHLAF